MKKERIIADFHCPVCDSEVYAVGFAWRCTRKGCAFTMGRSWKNDPDGSRYFPRKEFWQGSRDRYREEHGMPFEKGAIKLPEELFYAFERSYHSPEASDTPFWTASIWTREKIDRGGGIVSVRTRYYHETSPKKSKEEAFKVLKAWLKANQAEHIKLTELESKR
jgi:hypothetical protein